MTDEQAVRMVGRFKVEVVHDNDPGEPFDHDLPKTWGIDLSTHRDYSSPTHGEKCPVDFDRYLYWKMYGTDEDGVPGELVMFERQHHILPVYLLDHSGRTVRTEPFDCKWDSGIVGLTYISKNAVVEELQLCGKNWKAAQREECGHHYLRSMMRELDDHMTGNTWGFTITDTLTDEDIDSCWGFFGDPKHVLEQGVESAKKFEEYAAPVDDAIDKLTTLDLSIAIHRAVDELVSETNGGGKEAQIDFLIDVCGWTREEVGGIR